MSTTVSQSIVMAFGGVICAICAISMYSPSRLISAVRTIGESRWGIYAAVIVRILLGALLILTASDTRFPLFFKVLGTLSMVGAIVISFMGRGRIGALLSWFERVSTLGIRLYLLFGAAFGAFLIYGACPLR